jgi:hypothetical protein
MGSERFDCITLLYELHLFGIAEPSGPYICETSRQAQSVSGAIDLEE